MGSFVEFKVSAIHQGYARLRYVRLMANRQAGNLALRTIRLLEGVFLPLIHGPGSELTLPDFLIIGAQKSGTSSLAHWLSQKTDLNLSMIQVPWKRGLSPETHFFSDPMVRIKGLRWYSGLFSPGRINGEKTPEYLPRRTSLREIRQRCPEAKIIVMLRNPVSRAFSAYQHYLEDLPRSRDWDWLLPGHSFEANLWAEELTGFTMGLLARGRYAEQLEYLFSLFPKDQVKILVLERFRDDPRGSLKDLLAFLGGKPNDHDFEFLHRNRGSYTSQLAEDTRRKLEDYYRPFNQRLFNLLGYSIPEWESQK